MFCGSATTRCYDERTHDRSPPPLVVRIADAVRRGTPWHIRPIGALVAWCQFSVEKDANGKTTKPCTWDGHVAVDAARRFARYSG